MIGNKHLLTSVLCGLLLVHVLPLFLCAAESQMGDDLASPRAIVLSGGSNQPAWMELWGHAREDVRQGQKEDGLALYRELLIEKPQVEEALREYVLLLMDLEQWPEAGQVVQKLLEMDHSSQEYLLYGGRIALVEKRYERAARYLGQVYTSSPGGPWALEALKGQVVALQNLARPDMAYPLMEQLYLLVPHDEEAIRQLAQYSKSRGNSAKARTYYKTLLTEFGGTDTDFMESVVLFEDGGDQEMVLLCWQGYLRSHPLYLPFQGRLADYYLKNKEGRKALPHLLILISQGVLRPELFLEVGKIYLYQEGRPDKALYYYEEYRKSSPGDQNITKEIKRIQAILANDLLVIVENEGAWTLWRDLAKVIPDWLAVYSTMAEQLAALGKVDELIEVLEIVRDHNPEDQQTLLQLAGLYFGKGKGAAAGAALDSLRPEMQGGREYLLLRAEIAEATSEQAQGLEYYKQYLLEVPKDYSVVLKCLRLAAALGLVEDLQYFQSLLPAPGGEDGAFVAGSLLYGKGLLLNQLYTKAWDFYRVLLRSRWLNPRGREEAETALVTILQSEGNYFEAEQRLRLRLGGAEGQKDIVRQLIENNLLQKDWSYAWAWYDDLAPDPKRTSRTSSYGGASAPVRLIERIHILEASGKGMEAIEVLEEFMEQTDPSCLDDPCSCVLLGERLATLYYGNGFYGEAQEVLASLCSREQTSPRMRILSRLLAWKRGGQLVADSPLRSERHGTSALLERVESYRVLGEYRLALQLCELYLRQVPESVRARGLRAGLLRAVGDNLGALERYRELRTDFPGEFSFAKNILELQFESAKFNKVIKELAPKWQGAGPLQKGKPHPQVLEKIASLPIQQQLLLARALWADNRHEDALLVYKSLLHPAVDQLFYEGLAAQGLALVLPAPQKSILNILTFTSPNEPDRLGVVMSPKFTLSNAGQGEVRIAASLYARYRWQEIVRRELSVRQAMFEGDLYQAMREYQTILEDSRSPEDLYDLAGIYSQLGLLGKEAALYGILKQQRPGYPNLEASTQRNRLKRRLRVSSLFGLVEKEGREGYYDIRQVRGQLQAWSMPSFDQEFLFETSRTYSESLEVADDLWGNRLLAEWRWSSLSDFDVRVSLGMDDQDGGSIPTYLYNFSVNARLGDMMNASLELSQDLVSDTLESVREGISARKYRAALQLNPLPRLFGGADFHYLEYSDGNQQDRYELWSSYLLHSKPTLLRLRYGYEYSRNTEGNLQRDPFAPGAFRATDHPYWSPKEYWQHLLGLSFEHRLAANVLGRGAPSYYTLDYSFGYERGGYDNHQVTAKIFLEMNHHFLVNSSLEFTKGEKYQETNFFCSLIYRW